jgi:peptide-methionine (S)-S-oxide reductase
VSSGVTNHAEAVAVYYDPEVISYETLLVVFFDSHDPTTLNRQGPDYGRQYRSAIYYTSEDEKKIATAYINALLNDKKFKQITTEVVPFEAFYEAEDYHQDYKLKNPDNSYVKAVSNPRFESFAKKHPGLLKGK